VTQERGKERGSRFFQERKGTGAGGLDQKLYLIAIALERGGARPTGGVFAHQRGKSRGLNRKCVKKARLPGGKKRGDQGWPSREDPG